MNPRHDQRRVLQVFVQAAFDRVDDEQVTAQDRPDRLHQFAAGGQQRADPILIAMMQRITPYRMDADPVGRQHCGDRIIDRAIGQPMEHQIPVELAQVRGL